MENMFMHLLLFQQKVTVEQKPQKVSMLLVLVDVETNNVRNVVSQLVVAKVMMNVMAVCRDAKAVKVFAKTNVNLNAKLVYLAAKINNF
jgi:hypothetical protein